MHIKRSLAHSFVKLRIYQFSSVSVQLRQHFSRPYAGIDIAMIDKGIC